jgi:hypothetical protein
LVAQPKELRDLIVSSVKQFEPYTNASQSFHPKPPAKQPKRAGARFCATLEEAFAVEGKAMAEFSYVDREVVPSRTVPTTVFDDGSRATTDPRIDLLFVDEADGTPIAAEVKVGWDKTPFVALIQGLAGATQLATPNQRARLCTQYPNAGFVATDPACVDLLLLFAQPPIRTTYWHTLWDISLQLAKQVSETSAIRRIEFFYATWPPAAPITLRHF